MFVVFSGLPGTGKSAVAAAVAERLHAVHLSIDPVEDAMLGAGLPPGWVTGVAAYEAVRVMAEMNLRLGQHVVVDAVNDSEPARDTWRTAAVGTDVPVVFVLLTVTDEAEHRRRIDGRHRGFGTLPEPTWQNVQERRRTFAPWSGEHHVVRADGTVADTVRDVCSLLRLEASGPATHAAALRSPECWCCGAVADPRRMVHLGNHPEVALCVSCARWAGKQAWAIEDQGKTGALAVARDRLRTVRHGVVERDLHRHRILGAPLRWIGKWLP